MTIADVRGVFLTGVLVAQSIILFLLLIRAIIGPSVSDRLVSVNMMGTNIIAMIAVLAVRLGENGLSDIGLIYAMVSFLAVVLLTKVYMGAYRERKLREAQNQARDDVRGDDRKEEDRQ